MVRLLPTILVGAQLLAPVLSHAVPHIQPRAANDSSSITYPYPEMGTDEPADFATNGYFINHLCINVKNLTASIDFYSSVFGLRKLFTLHVSEHFSITYMGHPHGGKNGTGYQTAVEMNREKNNAEGLIELVHVDVPVHNIDSSIQTPNTFAHIGMVVPDTKEMQARLDNLPHIPVLKKYGDPIELGSKVAGATSLTPEALAQLDAEEKEQISKLLGPTNEPLIFVADPDGNLIEIQPQEGSQLTG